MHTPDGGSPEYQAIPPSSRSQASWGSPSGSPESRKEAEALPNLWLEQCMLFTCNHELTAPICRNRPGGKPRTAGHCQHSPSVSISGASFCVPFPVPGNSGEAGATWSPFHKRGTREVGTCSGHMDLGRPYFPPDLPASWGPNCHTWIFLPGLSRVGVGGMLQHCPLTPIRAAPSSHSCHWPSPVAVTFHQGICS